MASESEGAAAPRGPPPPPCYLVVHNVAKKHNIGTLLRSACAFGVAEVILVGSNTFNTFGAHGSDGYVALRHFPTLEEAKRYLQEQRGCALVGVEITPTAKPVHRKPFRGPAAFLMGNEGTGLSARQIALCDEFVYIAQYGRGTASLNVTVAASVVLHEFAVWAGYQESPREGAKYLLAERPVRRHARGVVCAEEDVARKRAERQRARDRGSASSDEEQPVFSLEDDDAPVLPATHST